MARPRRNPVKLTVPEQGGVARQLLQAPCGCSPGFACIRCLTVDRVLGGDPATRRARIMQRVEEAPDRRVRSVEDLWPNPWSDGER